MTAITTKTAFAKLLGISRSRLTQYVKMGMPVRSDRLVDQDGALAWIAQNIDGPAAARAHALLAATVERAASSAEVPHNGSRRSNGGDTGALTRERTAVAKERAALLRLQRRELEGELAPVAELGDTLRTVILTLRTAALRLPSKCAPRLLNLKSAGEAQRILNLEVCSWLEDLASARIQIVRKIKPASGWEDYVEYRDP